MPIKGVYRDIFEQTFERLAVVTGAKRIKRGWTPEEAFCLPPLPKNISAGFSKCKDKYFPNDITLKEALAPIYLNNLGYGAENQILAISK